MTGRRTTTPPSAADLLAPWTTEATIVAGILHAAAAMVRERTEQGPAPAHDRRPRLHAAIRRATAQTGAPAPYQRTLRHLAVTLTAPSVDRMLSRGPRSYDSAAEAIATLDGFGLDVGTIGAVDTAADILTGAAEVAALLRWARLLEVRGHGQIWAYPLGPMTPEAVEPGDVMPTTAPSKGATPSAVFYPVQRNVATATGQVIGLANTIKLIVFATDLTGTACCTTAWRSVPSAWISVDLQ